jgi:Carboxypeptidase regulatory-like domain
MTRYAIAALLTALPLAAQTTSVQGLVTDSLGAAVPEAIVTAKNLDTSAERKTLTSPLGEYAMLQMPPGAYVVSFEKPGFRVSKSEVVLQVETPSTLNMKLEVGQVNETVNVMSSATVVNTENASVGNPFTEAQIKDIPLQTRNVVSLLSVEPGVTSGGNVIGSRPDQNNVVLDGVDVNDNFGANGFNSVIPIPLDSVQEFRTTIAGQGADLGRSSGGQVAIVTKGGSNQFHGSAYEYNRNTFTSANTWTNNRAGVPRAALVRNQYGASLGGRIVKNKLFFFYNYEARTDRSASSQKSNVPTANFAQGNVAVALKDGRTVMLTPQDVANIDPLHIGESQYTLNLMKQLPAGNNPSGGLDKGLNFSQLVFNTPSHLDNHVQVARMDYNIDSAGRHSLMLRGTLNGAGQDSTLAPYPGQPAASRSLDNSRGMAVRYTAVISPTLVNTLTYGYTRIGNASTGNSTVLPSIGFTNLTATPRASQRVSPTSNVADDLTWNSGKHTLQFGVNMRFMENDGLSFGNLPSYSFNRNTLLGLGADIDADVQTYIQGIPGYAGAVLSSTTNVTNAFGAMFALLNNESATYHYLVNGTIIPFASPVTTVYSDKAMEGYAQDSFKWKRNVTITYGVRYSLYGVPYEKNGQQVEPTVPLSNYFAQRVGAMNAGVSGSSVPDSMITYALAGPLHNGPGYYPLDKNNFAPRLGVAYSPNFDDGSALQKIVGKGSVIRGGAGVVYDNYGTAMALAFGSGGSPGLASTVAQPVNTNFTTGFRYAGNGYPALPIVQGGQFPYTPPVIQGGFTDFNAVAGDLKAPYEYTLSANYSRPLPHKLSLELGYAGRLSHKAIVQQDYGQPLTQFKDPKSGQTWSQASTVFAQLYDSGLTAAQVKANPGLVPGQPFFENMFPGAKNLYINGGASANYYYDLVGNYSDSDLDALNDMDRIRQPNGGCISLYGCNTFYPLQDSGVLAYVNAGKAAYHAGTIVLRRAVSRGWGFDVNYTFSHAIDNGSASETSGGAALQDAFNPNAYRGPSDYDARHAITADAVVEIPIGKGKALLSGIPKWLDYVIGGWTASTLFSYHSGNPVSVTDSGVYNVNYLYSAFGILRPGSTLPASGLTFDQTGQPSIFTNTNAVNSFVGGYPGTVGTRGILRGLSTMNDDAALFKYFKLPKEGMRFSIRAEAFNSTNRVNFGAPSLSLATPTAFGEVATPTTARVMQFAGRLDF